MAVDTNAQHTMRGDASQSLLESQYFNKLEQEVLHALGS